jgi:hypothetical protein
MVAPMQSMVARLVLSWQVWDDDKLLMTYSVKDIRMGNPICNYKLIATKEFGLAILDRFKKLKAFI